MRELMLKLLTYEPFEKISGDEKTYIDAVLAGDTNVAQSFALYDELMKAFMHFVYTERKGKDRKVIAGDTTKLVSWFNAFYSFSKAGSIGILCDQDTGERTNYPVFFKKICFYCITEYNFRDADFLAKFSIKPNIINKWKLCPRYRKLINRDSYHTIPLQRNGRKQPYLTKVIKSAYYEASRQTADERFFDASDDSWIAPKKNRLLPFIDVFASSGTVAASVEAPEKVVNDVYPPVSCFLFAITNNMDGVRERLAKLHNNFVSVDMSEGQKLYTVEHWQKHKGNYKNYEGNIEAEKLMIIMRNNYQFLHMDFESKIRKLSHENIDFSDSSFYEMYYDIAVVWFFLNAITSNGYHGNKFYVTDMDIAKYSKYLFNVLGVKKKAKDEEWMYLSRFAKAENDSTTLKLTKSDIRIKEIRKFAKSLSGVYVNADDFRTVIDRYSDGFIYLDSPYFLTTDYDIPFQDNEHKQMLDLLRNADFKWLFSMQYKGFWTSKPMMDVKKRENSGNVLIKNYREYYCGFVNKFIEEKDKMGKRYYVTGDNIDETKADKLYVILFEPPKNPNEDLLKNEDGEYDEELKDAYMKKNEYKVDTKEMMICNFDVRRVIPYGASCVVIPFMKFLEFSFYENGVERDYQYIRAKAREYRAQKIQENYYTGAWV